MTRSRSAPLLLCLLAACADGGAAAGHAEAARPAVLEAAFVDSVRPVEEELRRFREGLEPVAELRGGAPSRDALVRRFVEAVERSDTAAAVAMVMSRSEFAYLYYPHMPFVAPPQEMSPQLAWFLMLQNSEKGITRVFRRLGGRPLGYLGHTCLDAPVSHGPNRTWEGCTVRRTNPEGDTVRQRLFGGIVERDGHFKFVSYVNEY